MVKCKKINNFVILRNIKQGISQDLYSVLSIALMIISVPKIVYKGNDSLTAVCRLELPYRVLGSLSMETGHTAHHVHAVE